LMYAAIFSDAVVYECQLKRLMKRTGQLALLYKDKAAFVSQTAGCNTNLNLIGLSNAANSWNLNLVSSLAEDIKIKNEDNSECRLW